GQQAHQRPGGKGQHGRPEQGGDKGCQYPEAGTQQTQQQNLDQQAVGAHCGSAAPCGQIIGECIASAQQLDAQAVGLFGTQFQPPCPQALGDQRVAPGGGMGTRQGDPQGSVQAQGADQQPGPFRLRLAQPVQVQLAILAQLTQQRGGAGQQLAQWRVGIQPLGVQVGAAIATGDHVQRQQAVRSGLGQAQQHVALL